MSIQSMKCSGQYLCGGSCRWWKINEQLADDCCDSFGVRYDVSSLHQSIVGELKSATIIFIIVTILIIRVKHPEFLHTFIQFAHHSQTPIFFKFHFEFNFLSFHGDFCFRRAQSKLVWLDRRALKFTINSITCRLPEHTQNGFVSFCFCSFSSCKTEKRIDCTVGACIVHNKGRGTNRK